jgi:2-polyprenyl-3-methyl-5-hydroxy-6-metoxy-1,4-benzoquinol methylase
VSALLRFAAPRAGDEILDAGCGPGHLARLLGGHGASVWGVDIAPEMLEIAKPWLDQSVCADIENLNIGRCFDVVICAGALDFTESPQRAFSRVAGHVGPGGRLVLLVPVRGLPGWIYRRVQSRRGLRVHLFSPRELATWGATEGLRLMESAQPFPHCRVLGFRRT